MGTFLPHKSMSTPSETGRLSLMPRMLALMARGAEAHGGLDVGEAKVQLAAADLPS